MPVGTWSIAAAADKSGNVQFLGVGLDGYVYHNIRYLSGRWQGWVKTIQPPGAGTYGNLGAVSAADDGDGDAQFTVTALNPNGFTSFYHTIRYANGTWQQGWVSPSTGMSGLSSYYCRRLAVTTPTYYSGPYDFQFIALC